MIKILEFIAEFIGWIRIVLSPFLIALVIAAIIYANYQDNLGLVSAIFVAAGGLITGIVFATRVWKKKGTINFISRISATPDLDDLNSKKKSTKTDHQL